MWATSPKQEKTSTFTGGAIMMGINQRLISSASTVSASIGSASTVRALSVQPSAEQLQQTRQKIDSYIASLDRHPDRRTGAYPYYLFHPAGQPVLGTVLLFHGFSAKPHQMWRLADYLFKNGFNVYQASIAGHSLTRPQVNWPQVDLKPEFAEPLKAKLAEDEVLKGYLNNINNNPTFARPNRLQQMALMARLVMTEPRLMDIARAIESPEDPDFDRYFVSSHLDYLQHAQARLAELDALPGPIYTVGLSVGGAVALGLAAMRPDRVRRVVSYAPLLKVYGEERRRYVNLAGPLDVREMGWDPQLQFPLGCLTAADRFGSSVVMSRVGLRSLRQVPTFMVLTENEDAADIETNMEFFEKIGAEQNGHCFYLYRAGDLVPHPMVDPTEVSQNMSNRFWQGLYQETFRFLTTGGVDEANMSRLSQAADVPQVPGVS